MVAFNSLFEMHPWAWVVSRRVLRSPLFQFSIWDALKQAPYRRPDHCRALSILYLRCCTPTSTPMALTFQFSIWDAIALLFSLRVLWSLIFQFSIWDARSRTSSTTSSATTWLSILYIEMPAAAAVLARRPSLLTFNSLFEMLRVFDNVDDPRLGIPFNSLFEMRRVCGLGGTAERRTVPLSILYLRCPVYVYCNPLRW